jgi:hypothetical protein
MKRIAIALAIISLAGCTSIEQQAADACPRIDPGHISTACYHAQLARLVTQRQANQNAAVGAVMGGTAFVNGYNAGGDHPLPMTNYGGHITMWSGQSGMMQGY